MANDLTGEFDLVAEFAIPAANRVLASMHRSERFLHSTSTIVDDTPRVQDGVVGPPPVVATLDAVGAPIVNHDRIGSLATVTFSSGSGPRVTPFDGIVNVDLDDIFVPPVVPSHLKGRAQLQLFPPTLSVPDNSGTRLTVHTQMLARYFP